MSTFYGEIHLTEDGLKALRTLPITNFTLRGSMITNETLKSFRRGVEGTPLAQQNRTQISIAPTWTVLGTIIGLLTAIAVIVFWKKGRQYFSVTTLERKAAGYPTSSANQI